MRKFVYDIIMLNKDFEFDSGRLTSALNLGSVLRLAFELKRDTEHTQDSADSGDEESKSTEQRVWQYFCSNELQGY